jgi:hypothetical protein
MGKKPTKTTLTIRVDQEWLDALDAWIAAQKMKPTRTEVIRVTINELIKKKKRGDG